MPSGLRDRGHFEPLFAEALCGGPRTLGSGREIAPVIVGGSMRPTLEPGQRVRVRPCRYLWPGQGACLRTTQGYLLVHRVVLDVPWPGRVFHVGDAGGPVQSVSRQHLLGRAVLPWRLPAARHVRELGRLVRAAATRRLRRLVRA